MNTKLLEATIAALNIAKETGLYITCNGKLRIEGDAAAVSVSQDTGKITQSEIEDINKLVDLDLVDLSKLKEAVLKTVDSELFAVKTDDRELLLSHMFKTVCTSVAFKALNLKCVNTGNATEQKHRELTRLNNADKFIYQLLPVVLCETEQVKARTVSNETDYTAAIESLGLTSLLDGKEIGIIRYAAETGLTCWLLSKDWKHIAALRENITGKVGYINNGSIQITLNDATQTRLDADDNEIITHRQVRFSRVLSR